MSEQPGQEVVGNDAAAAFVSRISGRQIKPNTWSAYVRRKQAPQPHRREVRGGHALPVWRESTLREWQQQRQSAKQAKRDPRSIDFLTEVAQVYRSASAAGEAPNKAVAAHFQTSRTSAGRWVSEARRLGVLEPAGDARFRGDTNP